MKNTTIIALAILLLTVPFSCSQSGKEEVTKKIIDVAASVGGGRIVDLEEVANDIRYIPLETSSLSLVGDLRNNTFEKDLIYFQDRTDSVIIFDKDGQFLRKFCKKGRGPQEYPYAVELFVEPNSGEIIVNSVDDSFRVLRYDIFGKLVSKFITPVPTKFRTVHPRLLEGNTYVASINTYRDKPEFSAVVYDSLGNTKLLIPIPKLAPYKMFKSIGDKVASGSMVMVFKEGAPMSAINKMVPNPDEPFLYKFGNNMRLVYDSNDTILSIGKNLQLDTPYIFNYGKYRDNSMDRSSISMEKGKHISLSGRRKVMESESFLFLQFALRGYAHEPYQKPRAGGNGFYPLNDSYAIFNKENGKFSFLNQTEKGVLGFRENLMGGPPFWPTYVSNDNSLVMVISAASLIEYASNHTVSPKLAEIVKNLNENNNPVVVIAR